MTDLKSCPFCGSTEGPHLVISFIPEFAKTLYWVRCGKVYGGCGVEGSGWNTEEEAVLAWNTRNPDLADLQSQIETQAETIDHLVKHILDLSRPKQTVEVIR